MKSWIAVAVAPLVFAAGCTAGSGGKVNMGNLSRPSQGTGSGSFAIHTTLRGIDVLPRQIRWAATTSLAAEQVTTVEFWIDGHLAWIRHAPPYVYGDEGSWLVATSLRPGPHTFVTSAVSATGQVAKETVTATVMAPTG